jgi:hypothetical protein
MENRFNDIRPKKADFFRLFSRDFAAGWPRDRGDENAIITMILLIAMSKRDRDPVRPWRHQLRRVAGSVATANWPETREKTAILALRAGGKKCGFPSVAVAQLIM